MIGLTLHYAEIIWNQIDRLPSLSNDDVCDYLLGRNLVIVAVAVACEVFVCFIASRQQLSFTVTLVDFAVRLVSV
ncbi:hypothetical protein [Cylindrospermum sp. FACHB-282]|uniref:hypothetical protein n=1 Tax=Cylindrospermum sp. FACHB-282 TaxID=2692794 RepID=UPI0028162892|nr:hypothetical protein [Cylindrospermum sp. FACHB-282]